MDRDEQVVIEATELLASAEKAFWGAWLAGLAIGGLVGALVTWMMMR